VSWTTPSGGSALSTVYTFVDPATGAWRNRLGDREPFPMTYRELEQAVAGGQSLAHLFGAEHVVVAPSDGQRPVLPPTGGDPRVRSLTQG
jgi:hypothetical protein